jgi:hypothetical protein
VNARGRRAFRWILPVVVAALFAAGAVWRSFHPNASENPNQDVQISARQDGYYLCLHRPPMTPAEMYRLVRRKLPKDNQTVALRGCQLAQRR